MRDRWKSASTDAAILALIAILPTDHAAARRMWQKFAPAKYGGILDGNGWTWDAVAQGYRSTRTGELLSAAEVKKVALEVVEKSEKNQRAISILLLANVAAWLPVAAAALKTEYIALTALGSGGFANIPPSTINHIEGDPNRPGPTLGYSLSRLLALGRQLAAGAISGATALARIPAFAAAGNGIFEEARRESHRVAREADGGPAHWLERNVLGDADHCHTVKASMRSTGTPGCPELTALGWVPLGTLPPPGERTCHQNCKCHLEYSRMVQPMVRSPVLLPAAPMPRKERLPFDMRLELQSSLGLGRLTVPTIAGKVDPSLESTYRDIARQYGIKIGSFKVDAKTGRASAPVDR